MLVEFALGALLALLLALPVAVKWCLGVRRVALGLLLLAVPASVVVLVLAAPLRLPPSGVVLMVAAATLVLGVGLLAYRFYRDPERRAPEYPNAIVSPADGEVIYVRESKSGLLPVSTKWGNNYPLLELTRTRLREQDAVVIGIAMSFLDVHVNRAPIAGRVSLRRHYPGRFGSLRRPETAFENERATTVIETDNLQVAVVQIASRLVRQIASFVHEGEQVAAGQRIGVIRLGSQVDLVLPARSDLRLLVQVGQRLTAGESIVALLEVLPATYAEPAADPAPVMEVGA